MVGALSAHLPTPRELRVPTNRRNMVTYICDKCGAEYDTCLELETIKIVYSLTEVKTYHVCTDCLRKWLGEEKV